MNEGFSTTTKYYMANVAYTQHSSVKPQPPQNKRAKNKFFTNKLSENS